MSIKRVLVLLVLPTIVMLATFGLFQLLRDSYTAEGRLIVEPLPTLLEPPSDHQLVRQEDSVPTHLPILLQQLQGDTVLNLLSYHMAIWRLSQDAPFGNDPTWDKIATTSWLRDMKRVFQQCIYQLRTPLPHTPPADSLWAVLLALELSPEELRQHLVIRAIPGTKQIRLQATGRSPEESMFMVNRLGKAFSRYWREQHIAIWEQELAALDLAARQQWAQVEQQQAVLSERRAHLFAGANQPELLRWQERLEELTAIHTSLQNQILRLRQALKNQRQNTDRPVVRVHQVPTEEMLRKDLQEAILKLGAIEQEIRAYEDRLAQADSTTLAPVRVVLDRTEEKYAEIQRQQEIHQEALAHAGEFLTFIPANRSRLPSSLTGYVLTALAGLASLLLWALVLLQIGFLKWPEPAIGG